MNYNSKKSKILLLSGISLPVLFIIGLGITIIISTKNTINPTGIVIHHSAVPFLQNALPLDVKAIDEIHQRRGYGIFYWGETYHVGYHYIILPDGTLQQGRPERSRGAHTKGYNDYIGICLIGDFSPTDNENGDKGPRQPTREQMQTLIKITNNLQSKYNMPPENIRTHKELDLETECPGEKFPTGDFFDQIKKSE